MMLNPLRQTQCSSEIDEDHPWNIFFHCIICYLWASYISSLVMLPQKNKTTTSTITNRTSRFVPTKKLNRDKGIIYSPKTYYQYISTTMRNDDMMRSSYQNQRF